MKHRSTTIQQNLGVLLKGNALAALEGADFASAFLLLDECAKVWTVCFGTQHAAVKQVRDIATTIRKQIED